MKKIFIAIIAVLGLAACIKDDIVPVLPADSENVVLDFSVVVPETQTVTKAFSDTPNISKLTVFVFDENKMLLTADDATLADNAETTDRTEFNMTLPQHPNACTVHFVANCPLTTLPTEGTETGIMTTMTTTGTNDAYWQCVKVPNLVAGNDALKKELVETYFTKIPLIRNFAKVTVEVDDSSVSGFTLKGYALINVPTSGTVVAYNASKGEYEPYNNNGTGLDYAALKTKGYDGFMPAGVEYDEDIPTSITDTPSYTYESKLRDKNNTALIVYGTYNNTEGYYKVDFVSSANTYDNGNYAILRNLHYKVKIKNVVGAGYGTVKEAVENVAGNNISASTETENLLNISDGTSRLFVDQVKKHWVSTGNFTIRYRYEPTINGSPSNGEASVSRSKETEDADAVISSYTVATSDDADGWRTITITPKALPAAGTVNIETLTIKAGNLSRVVTLYLHQPYDMTVACSTTSASTIKTSVEVNDTIPAGLPEEIFPLVFEIEDTQLCLSPDASKTSSQGAVPVTTDPSIIDASKETFHYRRTLTWAQYSALTAEGSSKTFTTYFLTNKASVSGIKVYVKSELFGTKSN